MGHGPRCLPVYWITLWTKGQQVITEAGYWLITKAHHRHFLSLSLSLSLCLSLCVSCVLFAIGATLSVLISWVSLARSVWAAKGTNTCDNTIFKYNTIKHCFRRSFTSSVCVALSLNSWRQSFWIMSIHCPPVATVRNCNATFPQTTGPENMGENRGYKIKHVQVKDNA